MKIRIALADDHPAVLAGIHHELNALAHLDIIGLARDSGELVRLLQRQPCDVLVTDYAMPGGEFGDGIALIAYLRENHPDLKIIVFTTLDNPALGITLADLGVQAVLNKGSDISLLAAAIQAAHQGTSLPRSSRDNGTLLAEERSSHVALSKREEEVIRLYVSGFSINEIAERLHRTKQTISSQKSNAMRKLGTTRDADLFRFALETGLVRDDAPQDDPPNAAAAPGA